MRPRIKTGLLLLTILVGLSFYLSVIGCGQSKSEQEPLEEDFVMPSIAEEVVITRCAPWLIDNPEDSSEVQHNEVVNLIIDHHWDLQQTSNGLFYKILKPGDGSSIAWGDRLKVDYTGYDTDLQAFQSSRQRGQPFTFYLGNVIQGWNDGLPLIKVGGRIILLVPAYKGYSSKGFGSLVKPDQHLIFDIEVLEKIEE
ncbi:MAG: FKBP-type peptidyl-prolyl cis-trans isomerase [Saprospiraceae bacterium]|nr:FKBP-type peptidyl-prolyl cis-trans isomerase [Saprospiraceae bacterium]